ncbi:MAG TPA: GAF domain-containing sensor histidine kinase [Candidatus Omnitrophota bacterium]|nr:GAF domain-containing sensor histidine kinase [Candidatus Omnitrophota bacterium]HPT07098.1 GAF domain-containing sensor histidine kinase [Candidatus Omnitrophota bacterium]
MSESVINIIGLIGSIIILCLSLLLAFKIERLKQTETECKKLRKSLDEMDEQAKLIIRTDMELNKTQEELDKKISSLYALQKLSRAISTTLEETQIFKRIDATTLEELGFERNCCFLWSAEADRFVLHLAIGYTKGELDTIVSFIESIKSSLQDIITQERSFSTLTLAKNTTLRNKVNRIFNVHAFVVSPILSKEGAQGLFFAGTNNPDFTMTEGDEELIGIFAHQVGQTLENARLFEKTWRAQQDLEKKVELRTHELTQALEEVKLISKRKTDFVSAVSHELRTPLTSIKGYASILLAGKLGEIPEEVRLRLEKVNKHSDELTGIVNDLLDISRIESGRIIMKQASVDLSKLVASVADLLSVQFKAKDITFSDAIPQEATTVWVDEGQIKRVFINIIGNAIKFTQLGGKISVQSSKTDKYVRVDIHDTGCGIPPEAQEKVFEEFYRVDNAINETAKGTGLGLALVKHIVEAHGGRIWVESSTGRGSTFSFTLPTTA